MPTVDEWFALAVQHRQAGNLEQAAQCYRQILQSHPTHAAASNNLANILKLQDKFDEAIYHYQQSLRHDPQNALAHHNLGGVLQAQGKLDEALEHFRQALLILPDFPEVHSNLALLYLLRGEFEKGWPEYEWRWRQPGAVFPNSQPLWDGSDLQGRTILLHAELGLGDTLQFVRYVPLVKARGGKVMVECPARLLPLLASAAGIDQLVPSGSPLPPFDVQAPLLSLPGVCHTSLATIPNAIPYLHARPELVQHWRRELEPLSGFKVAIAWQGNPAYRGDRWRSPPLSWFAPLGDVKDVQLISLQKGSGTDQMRTLAYNFHVHDLGSHLDAAGAFMDTAAIMRNVDLVICSDSAVAHLAGALGVPVWLALTAVPDWRWLLGRGDSPWYPNMRLFRQPRIGHWHGVFDEMQRCLSLAVANAI